MDDSEKSSLNQPTSLIFSPSTANIVYESASSFDRSDPNPLNARVTSSTGWRSSNTVRMGLDSPELLRITPSSRTSAPVSYSALSSKLRWSVPPKLAAKMPSPAIRISRSASRE